MITFLIVALKIIILLGFLILIHELGHFTVAKICKVKVNEFAIGFGPTIWTMQGKETKYALRLLPLGGFVSMEGEEQRSEDSRSFSQASIPKRIAIVAAGAIVNIIFGLIVYFILSATSGTYVSNEVNSTIDGYVAQKTGIQSGDIIAEVDGNKINSKKDLNDVLEDVGEREISVKIKRNNEFIEYKIKPDIVYTKMTGLYLDERCKIISVERNSPAEKQGIESNDILLEINGEKIDGDMYKALELIKQKGTNTILLKVKRGSEELNVELTPDYIPNYYLGVTLRNAPDNLINRCINGGMETKEFVVSILGNLKKLFTGGVGVDQMMGPVGISEAVAKTDGLKEFVNLLALISLSLGVTNLLPIPALDGGKIFILLIEAVRGKPIKEQTEINLQLLGFSLLIALSIYISYNDILRIF